MYCRSWSVLIINNVIYYTVYFGTGRFAWSHEITKPEQTHTKKDFHRLNVTFLGVTEFHILLYNFRINDLF